MSESSIEAISAINPPTGWVNDKKYLYRNGYWENTSGSLKNMLGTDYGLKSAQPIWAHDSQYGNIYFIFQAIPTGTSKTYYYVWNGIESVVCYIDAIGIEEIRASIEKLGGGKGYLQGLKLDVVTPLGG